MNFAMQYRQFYRIARFEREFRRGPYGRLARGFVLREPFFLPSNNCQWLMFPVY